MPGKKPSSERLEQFLTDSDRSSSETDQTLSDLEQSTSEADQAASARDQLASDRDQLAADRDQAVSDVNRRHGANDAATYARSRRTRSQTTLQRDAVSHARSETARVRDAAASDRDQVADSRDVAADARDALAVTLEAEIDQLEEQRAEGNGASLGMEILLRAAEDRKRAHAGRDRAALRRAEAAQDRQLAHDDRDRAATDRAAAAEELAAEGIDHLTGALRRRVGLLALERELARVQRSAEPIVVAFVDVNGLKAVNDTRGHGAGDRLLRSVVTSIQQALRPYDLILRFGGDEFVCSLAGQGLDGVLSRFGEISATISELNPGTTISVGLAEPRPGESVDALLLRADEAMIASRGRSRTRAT